MPRAPIIRENPLRNRPPIKQPAPLHRQAAANALRGQRRGCPNPACEEPNIVDGICHSCGRVVEESNIVSEIQFGESSSGAAVVQGSFLGADQGSGRTMGPAFARAGGGESREATLRDGRLSIQGMGSQFKVSAPTIGVATQIFKMAVTMNFIQGRRMDMVCAVCLYTACRKSTPCSLMLIDFADRVQVNVFKLGVTFRALHKTIPGSGDGIMPILPEDLIWRFTSRLEFGELNDKVAEDAIRMARRMSKDWMVMGRRPAGVVGACIILAARMNNFRRTVIEVVYVVKVTVQTIQKRLEEFKETDSSSMTVGDFLSNEFIEKAHDPPSFYQQTPEFQAKKKKRKRRDMGNYGYQSEEDDSPEEGAENGEPSNKRHKNAESAAPLRVDADGFSIPPLPTPAGTAPPLDPAIDPAIDPELMDDARVQQEVGATFSQLVREFGDHLPTPEINDSEVEIATPSSPKRRGRPRGKQAVYVPPEWENSEIQMEGEISELISDPNTMQHAANYALAKKRVAAHMLVAAIETPGRNICMDTHIGEDEFADDLEVQNCLLSPEDVAKKEKVWVNENKSWLRTQQAKVWAAKQAENRPPKAKRNRKPKAQLGTGQKGPANSPAEAAVAVLKERAFSKKINYNSMEDIFRGIGRLKNNTMGSAATSRASSEMLGSGSGEEGSGGRGREESEDAESEHSFLIAPKERTRGGRLINPTPIPKRGASSGVSTPTTPIPQQPEEDDDDDDEEGDPDDYITPDEPSTTSKGKMAATAPTEEELGEEEEEEDEGELEEEIDDVGMGDIDEDEGAFGERDFGGDEYEGGGGYGDDEY